MSTIDIDIAQGKPSIQAAFLAALQTPTGILGILDMYGAPSMHAPIKEVLDNEILSADSTTQLSHLSSMFSHLAKQLNNPNGKPAWSFSDTNDKFSLQQTRSSSLYPKILKGKSFRVSWRTNAQRPGTFSLRYTSSSGGSSNASEYLTPDFVDVIALTACWLKRRNLTTTARLASAVSSYGPQQTTAKLVPPIVQTDCSSPSFQPQ